MIKSRISPFFLFSLLLLGSLVPQAQTITNSAVLQKASQARALKETEVRRMVLSLAAQRGWPLSFHDKKGKLAYLRGLSSRGLPLYITTTDNIISAATIRTNQLWAGGSTGLSLSGSSANMKGKIAVWDEGLVRPTHVELTGRVVQVDGSSTLSDHSTHVAGTMIAAGVNPVAKGMSYGAQQLRAYDFNNDVSEMMAAAGASNPILISNHSYATIAGWNFNGDQNRWEFWGNPGDTVDINFGLYDAETQVWDSIGYNAPNYLIVKAAGNNRSVNGPAVGAPYYRMNASGTFVNAGNRPAGISNNDGYNIISTYGIAKNILTVGAVNPIPGGYSQPSDVVLTEFSSWGPSGDGRIKPDVVADGSNVLSSISTADNAYDIYSGTSMASPASAGSAFLLQELYSRIHGGVFMRAATLKGLLIHTTDEAGPGPGPDYQYGWGLLNIQRAASVITSDTSVLRDQQIREGLLKNSTEDVDSFTVVASGKAALSATVSWTDPAAVPVNIPGASHNFADTARKLINDLDLRVVDIAAGKTYMPWILNPFNRPAAATKGDNIRDNVEKVFVDSLVPGKTYHVIVSHKGSLARGSQAYSLLLSGVGGTAYCTSASTGATGSRIDNVTIANINNANTAGCKTYSDFTATTTAQLPVGQAIPFSITHSGCNSSNANRVISIFIDLNGNGSFNDPGEMVASSASVAGGTYSGSFTIPATATIGSYSRMRIITEDGATTGGISPCGAYTAGETQDYAVQFTASGNDVGVTALEYPTLTTCANDSQIVAIRIHNFGTGIQKLVPVTTVIKDNGGNTIATFTATCKDSIAPKSEVVFTYNASFPSVAGTTYTFTSTTALSGDLNTANDQNITTLTTNASGSSPSGSAFICSASSSQASLKATVTGDDLPLWYSSATATTPIASGASTTTTVIPPNNTYYLGLNDLTAKAGPADKLVYSNTGTTNYGAYFGFTGNFMQFTTSVPLTLESAKMYIGYPGKITFTLATLASYTSQGYSYLPMYSTTIDVYATTPTPSPHHQVNVAAGDVSDTGGRFYLNIPIPTPGSYILIIDCLDSTTAFVNTNIKTNPYPVSLPGVMSVTGNDFRDYPNADSLTYFEKFYFPLYSIGVRLAGCPSPRTAVVATVPPAPVITLNGNVFTSSAAGGNQWYRSGVLLTGATGQTDTAIYSGIYQSIVTDPVTGCTLNSNTINFVSTGTNDVSGASIGLKVSPNPNPGIFQLDFSFDTQDNLDISLINTLGQKVYESAYPNFTGTFSRQIDAPDLASGVYVLRIVHGTNTYIRKVMVKK